MQMHSYHLCLLHTHKIENICKQPNALKFNQIIEASRYRVIVLEITGIVKYKIFIHIIKKLYIKYLYASVKYFNPVCP